MIDTLWALFQAWYKNNPTWELSRLVLFEDGSGHLLRETNKTLREAEKVTSWNSLEDAIVQLGKLIGDD